MTGQHGGEMSSRVTDLRLSSDGKKIVVSFADGLPDADRYTISLTDVLRTGEGQIIGGERALTIVILAGDVDGSGEVTAADVAAVRQAVGQEADESNAGLDVDGSGVITGADMRAVRSRMGRGVGGSE